MKPSYEEGKGEVAQIGDVVQSAGVIARVLFVRPLDRAEGADPYSGRNGRVSGRDLLVEYTASTLWDPFDIKEGLVPQVVQDLWYAASCRLMRREG